MPGRRNPVHQGVSHILHNVRHTVDQAKAEVQGRVQQWTDTQDIDSSTNFVDIAIHFIGANGIPKMDVVGTADPYFVAKLDGNLSFVFVVSRFTLIHLVDLIDVCVLLYVVPV